MRARLSLPLFLALLLAAVQLVGCGESGLKIIGSLTSTGTVGTAYSGSLTAKGGSGKYTWNVSNLPPGVTFATSGSGSDTLTISGTPTTAGSYATAVALDSGSKSAAYTVTIVITSNGPSISGTLPATGTVGTAYTGSLTASGGTAPYSWAVTGLPTGVTPSGTSTATVSVSGTPTAAGTFSVTATVTDSKSLTASYTVSVVIAASSTLTITGTLPATGTVGTAYMGTITATGGVAPYSWSVTNLPAGVAAPVQNMAALTLSGTPTTAATYAFNAKVTDSANNVANYPLHIVISSSTTITISGSLPATGTVGTAYSGTITASGGTGSYTWSLTNIPPGLSAPVQNQAALTLSGTPSTAGTYAFNALVTDTANNTANYTLQIVISGGTTSTACATPTSGALPTRGNESALQGLPLAFELSGAGGDGNPIFWAGSFTGDGTGAITNADLDFNGVTDGPSQYQIQVANSSYSYGADGRGCLYLAFNQLLGAAKPASSHVPNPNVRHGNASRHLQVRPEVEPPNVGTVTFSFTFSSGYEFGSIEQFDYINSEQIASGQMHQQNKPDFAVSSLTSNFAFGASGWFVADVDDLNRAAIAGSFANAAGTLGSGTADINVGGGSGVAGPLTGGNGTLTTTAPSSTTGRGTGSYTIPNGASTITFDFAYYIVNANDIYFITSDTPDVGNVLLVGRALKALTTSVDLNGYYIPAISGVDLSGGSPGNNAVLIGTLQASAETIPTATTYSNDAGTYKVKSYTNGTYTLDTASGRVAISNIGSNPPVGYLTDPAVALSDSVSAFLVGTDDAVSYGFLALQTTSTPNFSNASLSGEYTVGTRDEVGISESEVGEFDFTSPGAYSAIGDLVTAHEVASQPNVGGNNGVVSVNSDGSGSFGTGPEPTMLVTNGPLIVAIDSSSSAVQPLLYILVSHTVVQ